MLADNNMFLAHYSFYPLKVDRKLYAVEIKGEQCDENALKAVINGMHIDTSASVDPKTDSLLIYDVETAVSDK